MKVVLAAAAAALVAGIAAQAGAAAQSAGSAGGKAAAARPANRVASSAPGPKCGGSLWKQLTLADNGKGVNWNPTVTTIPDLAKLAPPARITAARTTSFQKKVWKMNDVVIERYRQASNGELVLELFDVASSTYMNAYIPSTACMTSNAKLRKAMVGARNGFLKNCQAPTGDWQMLGAHAVIFGVGYWNPVKTTQGALQNGAELRPLVGLTITQGCGKG